MENNAIRSITVLPNNDDAAYKVGDSLRFMGVVEFETPVYISVPGKKKKEKTSVVLSTDSAVPETPEWYCDNLDVAKVSADGRVTFLARGHCGIHCSVGTATGIAQIRVID